MPSNGHLPRLLLSPGRSMTQDVALRISVDRKKCEFLPSNAVVTPIPVQNFMTIASNIVDLNNFPARTNSLRITGSSLI
jgi:hypothetical protein